MSTDIIYRIVNKARRIGMGSLLTYAYKSAGLSPSQVRGRWHGPIIVLNSLPKAGTHLIRRMVEGIPYMRPSYPTIYSGRVEQIDGAVKRIKALKRGQYVSAHMPFTPVIHTTMAEHGVRHVLLIRDPRDVVISFMKYASGMDSTHWLHGYLSGLRDDESRLAACICGVYPNDPEHPMHLPDVASDFNRFARWSQEADVLTLRFEDLIGEKGGGDAVRQSQSIRCLMEYIGYQLDDKGLARIATNSFGRGSTFNKGKTGSWRSGFSTSNKALFKSVANDCLLRWGYEEGDAW